MSEKAANVPPQIIAQEHFKTLKSSSLEVKDK